MKPIIAITSRLMKDNEYTYSYVNIDYINAIHKAGGIPYVLLPIHNMEQVALDCDGLLVSGGIDINPTLYHQETHKSVKNISDMIDTQDLAIIHVFHKAHKPILGICRGLQILNVYFKGSLIQDIPTAYPLMQEIHNQKTHRADHAHKVNFVEESLCHKLYGNQCEVNSFHHQAIKDLAPNFTISGLSEDGIIEAIEADNIIAVQWHPEGMVNDEVQSNLFDYFVDLCK